MYSGLFIAADVDLLRLIADRASSGAAVRVILGDPGSPHVAQRRDEEGIADALAAKIRNAFVLYRPLLETPGVELRLHPHVLHNSIYRADDEALITSTFFGVAAAHAPVLHPRGGDGSRMLRTYLDSFERPGPRPPDPRRAPQPSPSDG